MKKFSRGIALFAGLVLVAAGLTWADEMAAKGMEAATPTAKVSAAKHMAKAKMTKKKTVKAKAAKVKYVWVCPMGDYSGPRTKDGKCPNCQMDLVKQKVTEAKPAGEKTDKKM